MSIYKGHFLAIPYKDAKFLLALAGCRQHTSSGFQRMLKHNFGREAGQRRSVLGRGAKHLRVDHRL